MTHQSSTPARRRSRILGATLLVGGLAVAVGAAHSPVGDTPALDASSATGRTTAVGAAPATVAAPVAAPVVLDEPAELSPVPTVPDSTAALEAFFAAGYDYDDAVALARQWDLASEVDAKVAAGARLVAGEDLPIAPGSAPEVPVDTTPVDTAGVDPAVDAFFGAGYDYDDAVQLAAAWGTETPYDAKVLAGRKVLAGEPVPATP